MKGRSDGLLVEKRMGCLVDDRAKGNNSLLGTERYSRIHKDCHPTGLHSVRNPKILTAGIEVNSKKEILKISYLVK